MVRVVCEGVSDVKQIKSILRFLEIEFQEHNFIFTNGKSFLVDNSIPKYKTLLEHIENGFVQKVLFIVDVDNMENDQSLCGIENTTSKIETLQRDLKIENISDYFLACDPKTKKGYFESLLLSTVDDNVKKCYEDFRKCSELNSKSVDKNILTELHNLTKPEKPYDFNHPNFKDIKDKLTDLFKGTK
ncbi:MAG: hypothetical protein LGB68_02105 [Sulfurovum sp.]|nr:hypothetical protein [Sulfurovum sp.]MCB4778667.1 hypothetical protein [Sulfurovum sp.]MCB4781294.1 hypothetical protein [Sulfurovum sp.]